MAHPPRPFDDASDSLVRALMLAGLVPALVPAVIVLVLVHPLAGVAVAVLVAAAWAAFVWTRARTAANRLVAALPAQPVSAGSEPRLENLLESTCIVAGIAQPEVRVLPDQSLNALAVADGTGATFVVTRGMVDGLGRVELEGVLANLAARVRSGAARYATTVLALPMPRALAERLLDDAFGDQASVRSDLDAVSFTKYPPGLIRALATMAEGGTAVRGAPPRSATLWLADPAGGPGADVGSAAPQPLALRIAVLEEL